MLNLITGITIRIFSNSYLNVFQKILTNKGEHPSIVNFYTYLGLTIISFIFCKNPIFSVDLLKYILLMGILGSLGNYFIIKALAKGEMSILAPINSYKPVVALLIGIFVLKEFPWIKEICGILLIIIGTVFLNKNKILFNKPTFYRILALLFSGAEAIFIKKIILLTNISTTFLYWSVSGLIFALFFAIISKNSIKINKLNIKYQLYLILMVAIMQYSTNYVFSIMNVSYALALFQLSTLISVFLGINIFNEKDLVRKLIVTLIMIFGAVIIII